MGDNFNRLIASHSKSRVDEGARRESISERRESVMSAEKDKSVASTPIKEEPETKEEAQTKTEEKTEEKTESKPAEKSPDKTGMSNLMDRSGDKAGPRSPLDKLGKGGHVGDGQGESEQEGLKNQVKKEETPRGASPKSSSVKGVVEDSPLETIAVPLSEKKVDEAGEVKSEISASLDLTKAKSPIKVTMCAGTEESPRARRIGQPIVVAMDETGALKNKIEDVDMSVLSRKRPGISSFSAEALLSPKAESDLYHSQPLPPLTPDIHLARQPWRPGQQNFLKTDQPTEKPEEGNSGKFQAFMREKLHEKLKEKLHEQSKGKPIERARELLSKKSLPVEVKPEEKKVVDVSEEKKPQFDLQKRMILDAYAPRLEPSLDVLL